MQKNLGGSFDFTVGKETKLNRSATRGVPLAWLAEDDLIPDDVTLTVYSVELLGTCVASDVSKAHVVEALRVLAWEAHKAIEALDAL